MQWGSLPSAFSQQNQFDVSEESVWRESSSVKRPILSSTFCVLLGPLPLASLLGGCKVPLSGACTCGLRFTSKRGHKGSVLPPTQTHSAHSWFLHVCMSVYVCLTLTLSGPLWLSFQTAFKPSLLFICLFIYLYFWRIVKRGHGSTHQSLCVRVCESFLTSDNEGQHCNL